ncbi:response regulator receiver [Mycolicibacterium fortuitum subsp. acetamidolyticum]|uniref:Response regulator receiver n=1 Tax=Mycolicibacterium fortuitum subsp. acetamidolyticum TaxID=144550 RepID=A0A100WVW9_MYCFO|nr:response regulator receiver [Mycolicibacterium fortuitum subsp. acetamidolyticum]
MCFRESAPWITVLTVSTFKFFASIVLFAALLLVVLYVPAYLVFGGPAIPAWVMVLPALLFGLTVTAALDDPLKRPLKS